MRFVQEARNVREVIVRAKLQEKQKGLSLPIWASLQDMELPLSFPGLTLPFLLVSASRIGSSRIPQGSVSLSNINYVPNICM